MPLTLKAARVNKGLSQKEAAIKLGICETTLLNYEMGRKYPNVPIIKRIEDLYSVQFSDLFFRIGTTV